MTESERSADFADLMKTFDEEHKGANVSGLVWDNVPLIRFLVEEGFLNAPASTKYHGNYKGGLYDHSKAVFLRLNELTKNNNLKWERPESPFIIGMFHDLCKFDQYIWVDDFGNGVRPANVSNLSGHYEYNANTLLKGHGAKSVMLLSRYLTLTEEEILCIRYHMGAYEKEEWGEFDAAIRKYPNVFWTHAADMLASKVDGV